MPYVPANVPEEIGSAFLAEEHQRIANAYNLQEAFGALIIDIAGTPTPTSQLITTTPAKVENWNVRGPSEQLSDGPILVNPRLTPDFDLQAFEPGIYLLSFYVSYSHTLGDSLIWQIFLNGIDTRIGTRVDASQQTDVSSTSATTIFTIAEESIIDLRVSVPAGDMDATITVDTGALGIFKLRDLRTRFS